MFIYSGPHTDQKLFIFWAVWTKNIDKDNSNQPFNICELNCRTNCKKHLDIGRIYYIQCDLHKLFVIVVIVMIKNEIQLVANCNLLFNAVTFSEWRPYSMKLRATCDLNIL